MKFKQYLLEYEGGSRSVYIPEEEARDIIEKHCQQALKGTPIYRGVREHTSDYMLVDPSTSKQPRVSANTRNFYTLLLDNLPSWKKFPKRSKSLICTTNKGYATRYGDAWHVLPYDRAKIGVCSKTDIWESFSFIKTRDLLHLNELIEDIINVLGLDSYAVESSWSNLKSALDRFDEEKSEVVKECDFVWDSLLKEYEVSNKPFLYHLEKWMSPVRNGFRVVNVGSKIPDIR